LLYECPLANLDEIVFISSDYSNEELETLRSVMLCGQSVAFRPDLASSFEGIGLNLNNVVSSIHQSLLVKNSAVVTATTKTRKEKKYPWEKRVAFQERNSAGEKVFSCSKCHKRFSDRSHLKRHERIHTGEKPFGCSKCGQRFSRGDKLKNHQRICQQNGSVKFESPILNNVPMVKDEKLELQMELENLRANYPEALRAEDAVKVKMEVCDDDYVDFWGRNQENSDPDYNPDSDTEGKPRNIKSEDTKPEMNITVKNENSEGLDKKPGEKGSLTCNLCNKVFANKRNLREHHKIHTGEKEFSCPVCEKKFAQKGALTRHERTHTGLKPFQCSQCDYRCSDSSNLKNHEKRHTGERPFLCHQCDMTFTTLSNLKTHAKYHAGDTPFRCEHCNKGFVYLSELKMHERVHTGDKPYACSRCDYRCAQLSTMKRHENLHTGDLPFSCSYCTKRFNSKQNLTSHERTHTGEKPFECPECHQKFSDKSHLKRHLRIHTGEKPFQCSKCEQRFGRGDKMREHERNCGGGHGGSKVSHNAPPSERKNLPLPADLARIQYMSTMAHHHAAYVSSPDNSTVPPDSP